MAKNITFKKNSNGFRSVLLCQGIQQICNSKADAIANEANTLGKEYHSNAEFKSTHGTRSAKRAHAFVSSANWEGYDANMKHNVLEKAKDAGKG